MACKQFHDSAYSTCIIVDAVVQTLYTGEVQFQCSELCSSFYASKQCKYQPYNKMLVWLAIILVPCLHRLSPPCPPLPFWSRHTFIVHSCALPCKPQHTSLLPSPRKSYPEASSFLGSLTCPLHAQSVPCSALKAQERMYRRPHAHLATVASGCMPATSKTI